MNEQTPSSSRLPVEESNSDLRMPHPTNSDMTINEGDHRNSSGPVDDLLRRELAQLSLEDKLDLEDEIHGFYSRAPPETPDFLRENFDAMQRHIDKLWDGKKKAYLEARRIQSQYHSASLAVVVHVLKDEYRLRFLRAELYDPVKAATRYCNWLNLVFKHFGEVALTRSLYLADVAGSLGKAGSGISSSDDTVGRDAIRLLKEGWFNLLPSRDRAGRRILSHIGLFGHDFTPRARMRVILYLYDVASRDETTQRDGLVSLICPFMGIKDASIDNDDFYFIKAMPVRCTGIHIMFFAFNQNSNEAPNAEHGSGTQYGPVVNPVNIGFVCNMCLTFFGKSLRQVTRIHTNSRTETEYCLQHEYGIPVKDIPLSITNKIKLTQWKLWMKAREAIDMHDEYVFSQSLRNGQFNGQAVDYSPLHVSSLMTASQLSQRPVECPDMKTIAFRNGGSMFNHPPNKVLRAIAVSKERERDMAVTNDERRKIVDDVLFELRGQGFRFCRWNQDLGWYTGFDSTHQGEQMLRTCVSSALKDHLKRVKAARNCQEAKEQKRVGGPGNAMVVDTFTNQDHHLNRQRSGEIQNAGGMNFLCSLVSGKKRKGGVESGE